MGFGVSAPAAHREDGSSDIISLEGRSETWVPRELYKERREGKESAVYMVP